MLDVVAAGAALTGLVALASGGTVASPEAAQSARPSEVTTAAPTPVKMSLVAAVSAAIAADPATAKLPVAQSAAVQELSAQPGDGQPVPPPPVTTHQPTTTNQPATPHQAAVVHRSAVASQPIHAQRVIMIIRHGEKPGKGGGHGLTAAGWARAQGLASVFGSGRNGMSTPRAIFAAGATSAGRGQRTRETVSPLARRLGVPVNSRYGKGQEAALVRAASAQAMNGPVLIAWQHGEIPAIAKALKVVGKTPKGWSKSNYDGVWKFTWTPRGWVFSQGSEGLAGGAKHGKHG